MQNLPSIRRLACETFRLLDHEELSDALFIEWAPRFTRTVGAAMYTRLGDGTLRLYMRLSTRLWFRATDEQRRQVVIHEVCHLVTDHESILAGRPQPLSHGAEWCAVMRRAGAEPEKWAPVDNVGIGQGVGTQKPIEVMCACRAHWITKRAAKHIVAGDRTYVCTVCKGVLALV